MPEMTVQFEVFCAKCDAGLCNQTSERRRTSYSRQDPAIEVEPCEKCLEGAKEEGDSEGYDRGRADGLSEAEQD